MCMIPFDITGANPSGHSMVNSASNRNEYQKYFLGDKGGQCLGLTTLPPSYTDCLEIREPQPHGTLQACNRPAQGLLAYLVILLQLSVFF